MIAPSSMPMSSSAIMSSFSVGPPVSGSSPNGSSHSSLSPGALDSSSDMHSSSASARIASPPVSMNTSQGANECSDPTKLHKLKKPPLISGPSVSQQAEVVPGLVHFYSQTYAAPAEAHHHYQSNAVRDDLMNEAIRQQQLGVQSSGANHGLSYEALQAVTSVSSTDHHGNADQLDSQRRHALSQLTTVAHVNHDLSVSYISDQSQPLPDHPHGNSELVPVNVQGAMATTMASMTSSDGMQQTVAPIYVQMQNGSIQALPFQTAAVPSNATMAAQIANLAGIGQQSGMIPSGNGDVNTHIPEAGAHLTEMTSGVNGTSDYGKEIDDSDKKTSYSKGRGGGPPRSSKTV